MKNERKKKRIRYRTELVFKYNRLARFVGNPGGTPKLLANIIEFINLVM